MKKISASLLFGSLILLTVSCKKNQDSPANALTGTYTIDHLAAHTHSITEEIEGSDNVTTEVVSDYTTVNNKGKLVITGNQMTFTGLSYDLSTTLSGAEYFDGQFFDSVYSPFNFSLPPTNSTSNYKLNGADSIYFSSGFLTTPSGNGPQQTVPLGGKYVLTGNSLTINITVPPQTSQQIVPGGSATVISDGIETIVLKKQ